MPESKVLLSGLGIPESPRWHEGRLWFSNWIDRQVVAVGLDGKPEVMLTRDPDSHPMGYSIDWLPDGRLLTTGAKLFASGYALFSGVLFITVASLLVGPAARHWLHRFHLEASVPAEPVE